MGLMVRAEPETDRDPPSAEMKLIEVFVEAYIETAHLKPKQRARALLEAAARNLGTEVSLADVVPIRAGSRRAANAAALREAVAAFDRMRPVLVAKLPPVMD